MLNRIVIMGRITKEPELKSTQGGTPVTSFSLAVERDFKDKQSGEKEYIADLKVSQYGAAQTAAMPLQPAQAAVAQHPAYSAPYQPKNNRR